MRSSTRIEAYLGRRASPTTDLYALAALKQAVHWLPKATAQGDDVVARRKMMEAAAWGGIAMDQAGLGLAHALCGPLAARYHLHHGLGVALLLPATLSFNAKAIPQKRWDELRGAHWRTGTRTRGARRMGARFYLSTGIAHAFARSEGRSRFDQRHGGGSDADGDDQQQCACCNG